MLEPTPRGLSTISLISMYSLSLSLQIILAILIITCRICTTEFDNEAASTVDPSDAKIVYFVQVCSQLRITTDPDTEVSEASLHVVACSRDDPEIICD